LELIHSFDYNNPQSEIGKFAIKVDFEGIA